MWQVSARNLDGPDGIDEARWERLMAKPKREPIEAVLKRQAALLDKLAAEQPTDAEVMGGLVDDVRERRTERNLRKARRTR